MRKLIQTDHPSRLSRELRRSDDRFLRDRRAVAACSFTAAGAMAVVAAYQIGLLDTIPEPPLPFLDADRVDASSEAYARFHTPDAFIGLTSYAVTGWLAAAGGPERVRTAHWLPLALGAKVAFDSLEAARLTWSQARNHRAFCSWCLLAAAATFASAWFARNEFLAATRSLLERR